MIEVVCSVPHSGTRTLVKHLGVGGNSPRGRWMHFGYAPDTPQIKSGRYHLHIPVRDPVAVAASWARRGKNVDALVHAYRVMFESLSRPHTLHRIEDLPVLDGGDDRDRKTHGNSYVQAYIDEVMQDVVLPRREWFARFYDAGA